MGVPDLVLMSALAFRMPAILRMQSRFMRWVGALISLSIALRAAYYLGYKFYMTRQVEGTDLILASLGLMALGVSWLYFKKLFGRQSIRA